VVKKLVRQVSVELSDTYLRSIFNTSAMKYGRHESGDEENET